MSMLICYQYHIISEPVSRIVPYRTEPSQLRHYLDDPALACSLLRKTRKAQSLNHNQGSLVCLSNHLHKYLRKR